MIIAGFDGGCIGNGRRDAKASYGVYAIDDSRKELFQLSGAVKPALYEYSSVLSQTRAFTPATNNRGEFMGFIILMLKLRDIPASDVVVVSDSTQVINTMTEWLPKRKHRGTVDQIKKNLDLIKIADVLLTEAKTKHKIAFKHVRSHVAPPTRPGLDHAYWYVNDMADKLATLALATQ